MNPEFQPGEQLVYTRGNSIPKIVRYIGNPVNNASNALVEVRTANGYIIEVSPSRLQRITNNLRRNLGNKYTANTIRVRGRSNRNRSRRNRSRRGGAYNVRPRFHIGQRVEVKWLNERGGFSWQPATVTRMSYKANGEYHLITFELDRMPGHYHQTPEYVRPLNNNAMAVN